MEVQLQSLHEHPLVLTDPRDDNDLLPCSKCKWFVNKTSYYCCSQSHCSFTLHYNCTVDLPQHIIHPLHPHHPLTLVKGMKYCCQFCHTTQYDYVYGNINGGSYTCMECNFHVDFDCALLPTITCGKHIQVKLVCHLKPMALVENYDDYNGVDGGVFECYVCQTPCGSGSSTSTFVCTICNRFIHDSCTELPLEMKNPFHPPSCSLSLIVRPREKPTCDFCHRKIHTFFYQCGEHCQKRLKLCLACTFLRPTIKYPGHNHLLCLMEKFKNIPDQCNAYGFTNCRQSLLVSSNDDLNCASNSFILRCVLCDFNVHLLCGPLPCTIKHKCHIHPLTLSDSIVEDNSGEYYCDSCETERDPRLCVYYCAECKYIAHVHCVISEVVRALKGDFKDVEFRLVGQREQVTLSKFNSTSTTMKDIVMNASISEPLLCKFGKRPTKLIPKGKQAQIVKNSIEFYTDENFAELIHRLHNSSSPGIFDNVSLKDLETFEIVNVGGYMISWNYAHILKDLIDKHGDIGADSCLTIENKSLIYFTLCGVINSMRTTLLVHVTEDLLQEWYACLNYIVKFTGFKIDFIYARLEQVVPAYYGLQASTQMEQKIADLEHQVLQLRQQIEKLEADLESDNKHLEEYRKHRRFERNCSNFMKECLCKASMLKWEAVGQDLL